MMLLSSCIFDASCSGGRIPEGIYGPLGPVAEGSQCSAISLVLSPLLNRSTTCATVTSKRLVTEVFLRDLPLPPAEIARRA